MQRNIWIAGAVVVVLLGAGLFAAQPYMTALAIRSAVAKGQPDRLDGLVDFPAVRADLKAQLNARLVAALQADPKMKDNPFAGLAMLVAPAIVDKAVDAYATPDGIAQLSAGVDRGSIAPKMKPVGEARPQAFQNASMTYVDLNAFRVTPRGDPAGQPTFVLGRVSPFSWKLTRIELPKDMTKPEAAFDSRAN